MNDSDRIDEDTKFARELARQHTGSDSNSTSDSSDSISKRVEKARPILNLLDELKQQNEQTAVSGHSGGTNSEDSWINDVQQLGRFKIDKEIGRGGNGIVVLAFDSKLDRKVALKIPRFEAALSGSTRRRFEREAQAAAMLSHPAIVTVYEAGHDRGLHFIASQFIDGIDMARWIDANSTTDFMQTAQIVALLAEAIEHAHRRGVLHRDLKAANVIVQNVDQNNTSQSMAQRCRITDFGLATLNTNSGSVTGTGAIVGTPTCMSPEQASAGKLPVDARTDVYGLGTILYQLLTGKTPFEGDDIAEIVHAVKSRDPVAPNLLNRETPADLNAICMSCLEKESRNRYSSAFELQQDLQRFVAGEPVVARPISRIKKLARWIVRNQPTATMIGAIIGLMLLLTIGSILASISLNNSRINVLEHLNRETAAKKLAKKNELAALESLYESNVASAQALVRSGHMGQSHEALSSVMAAANLRDRIEIDADQLANMRSIVAETAKLVDTSIDAHYSIGNLLKNVFHNRSTTLYAIRSDDWQHIEVRKSEDNSVAFQLDANQSIHSEPVMKFSPNDKYFGAIFKCKDSKIRLFVWDLKNNGKLKWTFDTSRSAQCRFDFSCDNQCIAFIDPKSHVMFVDLTVGNEIASYTKRTVAAIKFANGSKSLVAHDMRQLVFIEFTEHEPIEKSQVEFRTPVFDLDWSSDDNLLAVGGNDKICYIFDAENSTLKTRLIGHGWQVIKVSFHANPKWVGTYSRDRTSRIWSTETGEQLFQANSIRLDRFDPGGRYMATQTGRHKFWSKQTYRAIPIDSRSDEYPSTCLDGRILAICQDGRFGFFDLQSGRQLANVQLTGSSAYFTPDESKLVIASQFGFFVAPIIVERTDEKTIVKIGPPHKTVSGNFGGSVVSNNSGDRVAITSHYPYDNGKKKTGFIDLEKQQWLGLKHPMARWHDLTNDGTRMATGTWHGSAICIWDTQTGKCIHTIDQPSCQVKFSPDGSMLAFDNGSELVIHETQNWTFKHSRKKKVPFAPTPIAFSNNWEIVAALRNRRTIELIRSSDFQLLYSLSVPEDQFIESLTFDKNDRWLIAGTSNKAHVWDLQQLESLFQQLGIESGFDSSSSSADASPVEVVFDSGSLRLQSDAYVVSRAIRQATTYVEELIAATADTPISEAGPRFIESLEKIILVECPPEFQSAFQIYVQNWRELLPLLTTNDYRAPFDEILTDLSSGEDNSAIRLIELKTKIDNQWSMCVEIERQLDELRQQQINK